MNPPLVIEAMLWSLVALIWVIVIGFSIMVIDIFRGRK
jgi:hypothetical protein